MFKVNVSSGGILFSGNIILHPTLCYMCLYGLFYLSICNQRLLECDAGPAPSGFYWSIFALGTTTTALGAFCHHAASQGSAYEGNSPDSLLLWHRKLRGWHKHGNEDSVSRPRKRECEMFKLRSGRLRFAGKWQKKKTRAQHDGSQTQEEDRCSTLLRWQRHQSRTRWLWKMKTTFSDEIQFSFFLQIWNIPSVSGSHDVSLDKIRCKWTAELHVYIRVEQWWVWPERAIANTSMWCPRKAADVARDRPSRSGVLE